MHTQSSSLWIFEFLLGRWLPFVSTGVRLIDLTGFEPRDVQDYCVRHSSSGTSAYSS